MQRHPTELWLIKARKFFLRQLENKLLEECVL